jgi:hypothetical protein
MSGFGQHVVVNLRGASGNTLYWVLLLVWCGASGKTLYWVLLLVYVGPREHITGYCCWLMWASILASGNTLYWVLFFAMLHLGQHTLLGIVVGSWGASDNTLYWVLLWVMQGFGQHTLLGIIRSDVGHLHQWVQNNPFFNSRKVEVSVFVHVIPLKLLKWISPHKQNHMALLSWFPINLYKCATIQQISYSKTSPSPKRPEDGCAS